MNKPSGQSLPSGEPFPRAERLAVIGAFLVYLIFQFHAAAFHGYWGQDWLDHKNWIAFAANNPWTFFTQYAEGRTNPPLFHLLGAAAKHIVGSPNYLLGLGVVNVIFGFIGACFAYGVIRQLIASPLLRVACIVFILFLPFAMIHAQVIASDALAAPLFFLLLWLAFRIRPADSRLAFGVSIVLLSLVMAIGLLAKFTFISTLPALGAWALLLWRTRVLSTPRLVIMLLVVVALPGIFAYKESVHFRSGQTYNWGMRWPARLSDTEMNPRSLLWFRAADTDVFSAPSYDWKVAGRHELLINNQHSFPALLHLAMFTDILNIYQFDPYDQYFGQRTERNHRRMQLAVQTAAVASGLAAIAVITLLIRSLRSVLVHREPNDLGVLAALLFSMAWFGNIVAAYPLVADPYLGGYWLPRLLVPALLGFFIVGFVFLDRVTGRSKKVAIAVTIAVVGQSILHASFLWPHRSDEPLYEPNADIANSTVPVLRVLSWQDSYRVNQSGEYWLETAIGIVVYRPAGASRTENWSVSFTVAPGPSSPGTNGMLRVSSRDFPPKPIEFEGSKNIHLEIPIASGRTDIRVELISPEPVEQVDDPQIRMAKVTRIEVRPPGAASPLPISP